MLTMHAAADACRPHLSWGYSLGWGRQKSRTTHACSCSRSMCVDSGRVGRCSLPLARSLPTRWTRLGPCGPPTAEEQQLVTSIASVLTPYVPCRRARLCHVYCPSASVSQSVSQSPATATARTTVTRWTNPRATGERRGGRYRPMAGFTLRYVTIWIPFFLFCFEKMLYYFLFGRETFDPLACTALFFFLPLLLVFLFFYAAACSSLCEHRSYTSIQSWYEMIPREVVVVLR